jgi:hypothetical protein
MSDASDGDDNNHPPSNRQMFAGIKQTDMNASSANMQSKVDSFVVDINTNTLLLSASSTDSSVSHSTNNIKTFSINPISISSSSSLISNNESVQSKNSLLTVESGSRGSLLNGASVRPGSAPPRSQSIAKPPPPPRGSSLRNDVSKDKKPSDFVLRNLMNPVCVCVCVLLITAH